MSTTNKLLKLSDNFDTWRDKLNTHAHYTNKLFNIVSPALLLETCELSEVGDIIGVNTATNGKQYARLLANYAVAEDKSTLVNYEVINAKFKAQVEAGKSAFVFGVKGVTGKLEDGAYSVDLCKTTDGAEVQLVKYYKEDNALATQVLGTLAANSFGDEWAEIEISVNKNGSVTVYENGKEVASFTTFESENEKLLAAAGLEIGESDIVERSGDGREIRLEFYRFLRPEIKFETLAALQQQILQDAAETRRYFETK